MSDNIKVAVRLRPALTEVDKNGENVIFMEDNTCVIRNPEDPEDVRKFNFTRCIWSFGDDTRKQRNEDIFNDLGQEVLENVFDGYNWTIFTYGQTGAGKTYTITGNQTIKGLLQLMSKALFDKKKELESQSKSNQVTLKISYLEIYNEKLKDLLDPSDK